MEIRAKVVRHDHYVTFQVAEDRCRGSCSAVIPVVGPASAVYYTRASTEHNHAKPQYEYDHARAIAKAEAAKGYAEAALIYYKKFGTKQ